MASARLCAPTTTAAPSRPGSIRSIRSPSSRWVKPIKRPPDQNSAVPYSASPALTTVTWISCISVAMQHRPQNGAGLGDGGTGRVRVAERVEHHEVVDRAVVADGRDRDSGGAQARPVRLALVAQHVGLVDDHERRRDSRELLVAGP